jgi:ankyrin repeat protein
MTILIDSAPSDLPETLSNIHPLHLVETCSRLLREDVPKENSIISNAEDITALKAKILAEGFSANKEEFQRLLDGSFEALKSQIDSATIDNYSERLVVFKKYIDGRWNAAGENNDSRRAVMLSTCNMFLGCGTMDFDVFISQFPPQPEDFNCLSGISARIASIKSSNNPFIKIVSEATDLAVAKAFESLKRFTSRANEPHLMIDLKRVFGLITQEEALAIDPLIHFARQKIPALDLLVEINNFPKRLSELMFLKVGKEVRDESLEDEVANIKSEIVNIIDGLGTFEPAEKLTLKAWVETEGRIELKNFGLKDKLEIALTDAFKNQGLSEEELKKRDMFRFSDVRKGDAAVVSLLKDDLAAESMTDAGISLAGDDLESESVVDDTGGWLSLNVKVLTSVIKDQQRLSWKSSELKEVANKAALKPLSQEMDSLESVAQFYSKSYLETLVQNLNSEDITDNITAINVLYALSKSGYGSAILHVCKKKIFTAAKGCKDKFTDNEASAIGNLFKLESYLAAAENALQYFTEKSPLALEIIDNGEIKAGIPVDQLLFLICNLSTEDALELISKRSGLELLNSFGGVKDFGTNVSFYLIGNIRGSLLLRPDGVKIIEAIADKSFGQNEVRAFMFNAMMLNHARNMGLEEIQNYMLDKLGKISPEAFSAEISIGDVQIKLKQLSQIIIKYFQVRRSVLAGDNLLKLTALLPPSFRNHLLLNAVKYNHPEAVKQMIGLDLDINIKDQNGFTPLTLASHYGHKEVVKALLSRDPKPDLKSRSRDGLTALALAAQQGHEDVVTMLLEQELGLDVGFRNLDATFSLMAAAGKGQAGVVNILLAQDLVPDPELKRCVLYIALQKAAINGHEEIIRIILSQRPTPLVDLEFEKHNASPLAVAAGNGHANIVKLLLAERDSTPDIDVRLVGNTPLLLAERDSTSNVGNTPLLFAVRQGHEEVVQILLNQNPRPADVNAVNQNQDTPLLIAARSGHAKIIELLFSQEGQKPNIDCSDHLGATPLMIAATEGYLDIVKVLLNQIPAPSLLNQEGVLNIVEKGGNVEIATALRDKIATYAPKTKRRRVDDDKLPTVDSVKRLSEDGDIGREQSKRVKTSHKKTPSSAPKNDPKKVANAKNLKQTLGEGRR